jgi:hypothetical protein
MLIMPDKSVRSKSQFDKDVAKKKKDAVLGASGGYIKPGSTNFDLIINILVGIRRSLTNLVDLPNLKFEDH